VYLFCRIVAVVTGHFQFTSAPCLGTPASRPETAVPSQEQEIKTADNRSLDDFMLTDC